MADTNFLRKKVVATDHTPTADEDKKNIVGETEELLTDDSSENLLIKKEENGKGEGGDEENEADEVGNDDDGDDDGNDDDDNKDDDDVDDKEEDFPDDKHQHCSCLLKFVHLKDRSVACRDYTLAEYVACPKCQAYTYHCLCETKVETKKNYIRYCKNCKILGYAFKFMIHKLKIVDPLKHAEWLTTLITAHESPNKLKCLQLAPGGNIPIFPNSIIVFSNLSTLIIRRNSIKELPDCFGHFTSLTILDMSHNQIVILPSSVYKLEYLERLRINNNKIQIILPGIANLKKLTYLRLENNPLVSPSKEMLKTSIGTNSVVALMACLTKRRHSELVQAIKNVSEQTFVLNKTAFLKLKTYPKYESQNIGTEQGFFHRIRKFFRRIFGAKVARNGLATLYQEEQDQRHKLDNSVGRPSVSTGNNIYKLKKPEDGEILVDPYITKLAENSWIEFLVPGVVADVYSITEITLTGSECQKLPESLSQCANLVVMDFSHNHISHIPKSILHLQKLEVVNLSNNHLTSVTPYLGFLPQLNRLCLASNPITSLPVSLTNLTKITELDVSNTLLSSPPMEICELGLAAIFRHLTKMSKFRKDLIGCSAPRYRAKDDNSISMLSELCQRTILSTRLYQESWLPYLPPRIQSLLKEAFEERKSIPVYQCCNCKGVFTSEQYFLLHDCINKFDLEWAFHGSKYKSIDDLCVNTETLEHLVQKKWT